MTILLAECREMCGSMSVLLHNKTTICTRNEVESGFYKEDFGTALVSMTGDVIGIASWYTTNDEAKVKLDIYTAVYPYITWIESFIKQTP